MRHITKGKQPKELTAYQATPNVTYNGFADKEILRKALIKEQLGLCAYCNKRITNDWDANLRKYKTEIEHYLSQELHPEKQLDYKNFLGVCNGNAGNPPKLLHCDKSRPENSTLAVNPLKKNDIEQIKYKVDGTIFSDNKLIDNDLNKILNLNISYLQENRKKIRQIAIDRLNRYYPKKKGESFTKSELQQELNFWESIDKNGFSKEYCQVAVYFLQNKLRRL